jgi:uncharacterized protein
MRRPSVRVVVILLLAMASILLIVRWRSIRPFIPFDALPRGYEPKEVELIESPRTPAEKIVNGAKMEARRRVSYDAAYVSIPYPNGDVPADRGACTDVVIRALRNAGYDLQKLIYEDKLRNPGAYPRYSIRRADHNIDHRRVPNHIAFFRRHGTELPTSVDGEAAATWKPGDIVYWKFSNNLDHTGVVSNDLNDQGLPLVIHNCNEARQEDCLTAWRIVGHFRYPPIR